ncbi:hypothetical protein [Vulcanococcus limneticus]|uniref:hypothetical protein n=1 Tax=Vulcanococcus limneticus TaxID=2170428 RepID=UPI00398C1586
MIQAISLEGVQLELGHSLWSPSHGQSGGHSGNWPIILDCSGAGLSDGLYVDKPRDINEKAHSLNAYGACVIALCLEHSLALTLLLSMDVYRRCRRRAPSKVNSEALGSLRAMTGLALVAVWNMS